MTLSFPQSKLGFQCIFNCIAHFPIALPDFLDFITFLFKLITLHAKLIRETLKHKRSFLKAPEKSFFCKVQSRMITPEAVQGLFNYNQRRCQVLGSSRPQQWLRSPSLKPHIQRTCKHFSRTRRNTIECKAIKVIPHSIFIQLPLRTAFRVFAGETVPMLRQSFLTSSASITASGTRRHKTLWLWRKTELSAGCAVQC